MSITGAVWISGNYNEADELCNHARLHPFLQVHHPAENHHPRTEQLRSTHSHDPVTSLQTFREILEHGHQLSNMPSKHQTSQSVPKESDEV